MKVVYYPLQNLVSPIDRAVITIGVFDGLHKGHLLLLKEVLYLSQKLKGNSVVITFSPHPQKEKLIYSLAQRLKFLKELGIDVGIIIKFSSAVADILPEEFVKDVVLRLSRPLWLIVGENFHFGKDAAGDINLLKSLSHKYDFNLKVIPPLKSKGMMISSSYIRNLILQGKIEEARKWLSFPFTISGRVVRGKGMGGLLGFPTANLNIDSEIIPAFGVYIVKIKLKNKNFPALCYIGNRPTFNNLLPNNPPSFEIHILNFKKSLYKEILEVEFIKRLRAQKRFSNIHNLIQRIKQDIQTAHRFFAHYLN
ncbi:MAG: bifunctional riboflavin kinase/FAD synthetase [Candidatus Omnitrophica bacterium]|nr:bifunctional riboflavin kinase/FAD synthetase [Candidatus Omnitrophota bacterium]